MATFSAPRVPDVVLKTDKTLLPLSGHQLGYINRREGTINLFKPFGGGHVVDVSSRLCEITMRKSEGSKYDKGLSNKLWQIFVGV